MSSPPRIPDLLPADQVAVYFVTFCVAGRAKVLANARAWEGFERACKYLVQWKVFSGVIMPDHVHVLIAPLNRELSIKNAVAGLKKGIRDGDPTWSWQQGCFDRLLRSDESAQQKWEYIRENPVRAGLVSKWEDWPFRFDSF